MTVTREYLTEDQFMSIAHEGCKLELVEGEAKEVPTGVRHDAIVAIIIGVLMRFLGNVGYVFSSNAGFKMKNGNIRCPDVSFVRKERVPDEVLPVGYADFVPDLCVEVMSPTQDNADMFRKIGEYFESGVAEAWVLQPQSRRLTVHRSLDDARTYTGDDVITLPELLPEFHCRVDDLFPMR